ncbi:MAG: monooxygenase [Myxococcota bacterium]
MPLLTLLVAGCGGPDPADGPDPGTVLTETTSPTGTTGTSLGGATYWRDVQPVLARSCVTCHREGDIAPFPLTEPDDAVVWAEAMRASVEAGTMPPWPPSADCAPLRDPRALAPDEVAAFGAWIDAGLPLGDPADGVDVPEDVPLQADLVVPMAEAYTPRASADDYRCFVLDWPEPDPTFVTAYEVVPGRRDLVHHVILYAADGAGANQARAADEADPGPGYTCYGSSGVLGADLVGGWVPGVRGVSLPEGTGMGIAPGSVLIVQVHYNTLSTASPGPDLTSVAVQLADDVPSPAAGMLLLDPRWLFPGQMDIPAGEASVVHEATFTGSDVARQAGAIGASASEPVTVHRVGLHMHTLGKRAVLTVERDGEAPACVLDIPAWDFDWQGSYALEAPLVLAPDDRLHLSCEWDNSGPDAVDVDWGDGTSDEMCLTSLYVTAP